MFDKVMNTLLWTVLFKCKIYGNIFDVVSYGIYKCKSATRDFPGQARFLGMRVLWQTFCLQHQHTNLKAPRGIFWIFSLLDALKTAFLMKYLTHRSTQSGYFFLKLRKFFSIFKKMAGKALLPPLHFPMFASEMNIWYIVAHADKKSIISTIFEDRSV